MPFLLDVTCTLTNLSVRSTQHALEAPPSPSPGWHDLLLQVQALPLDLLIMGFSLPQFPMPVGPSMPREPFLQYTWKTGMVTETPPQPWALGAYREGGRN